MGQAGEIGVMQTIISGEMLGMEWRSESDKKVKGYPGMRGFPGISLPGDRTVHLQCAGNVEIREYSRVEVQLRLQGARKSMQSTYSPSGMGMEVKWHRLSKLVE